MARLPWPLVGRGGDDVRSHGHRVMPACWYVRQFIDTHEGYADLLA